MTRMRRPSAVVWMKCFGDRDMAVVAAKASEEFVVVAGDVNDARAFARFAQEFLDDVVVLLRPIDSAPHLPDIDQVADDVERFEIVIAQEFEERSGIAAARPQVHVGNPGRAQSVAASGVRTTRRFRTRGGWIERLHFPVKNSRRGDRPDKGSFVTFVWRNASSPAPRNSAVKSSTLARMKNLRVGRCPRVGNWIHGGGKTFVRQIFRFEENGEPFFRIEIQS